MHHRRGFSTLKSFHEYKQSEQQSGQGGRACTATGALLEYETLELRVNPPNVDIQNRPGESITRVTVDSANRPGTLVEVVQHFTELGLEMRSARISSDGGWFVDSFEIQEADGSQVSNPRKLESIRRMLDVYDIEEEGVTDADETDDVSRMETTVFELAGEDKPGLLSETTRLLTVNGCNVRSAAVWTYNKRAAFVLSVTEKGQPVLDGIKLQRLRQILFNLVDSEHDGILNVSTVRGEVHHDRRLHQLMLAEEQKAWDRSRGLCPASSLPLDEDSDCLGEPLLSGSGSLSTSFQPASLADSASSIHSDHVDAASEAFRFRSTKYSRPVVRISTDARRGYWLVAITCKDRNKLLFDTVCTLADMQYEVYHATIDSHQGLATQEYWIKAINGSTAWDELKAQRLVAMMEAAIQRRFPAGLKIHVHSSDRFGCLAELTQTLQASQLSITRAKVRTYAAKQCCGHTFYVVGPDGSPPDREHLESVCGQVGGRLMDGSEGERPHSPPAPHRFSYSLLRQWHKGWDGVAASPGNSSNASL